jgi:hypothetical protein
VEWDVAVAEGGRRDDIRVSEGAFAHVDVELLHFVDCELLVQILVRDFAKKNPQSNERIWSLNRFAKLLASVEKTKSGIPTIKSARV